MKNQSELKLYKELKREVVHKEWLLKNLPKSKQVKTIKSLFYSYQLKLNVNINLVNLNI